MSTGPNLPGIEVQVGASAGTAIAAIDESAAALIERADALSYEAKHHGRTYDQPKLLD